MFSAALKIELDFQRVLDAADKAADKAMRPVAFAIARSAKASILRSPKGEPSPPGEPVRTRKGRAPRAIRYEMEQRGFLYVIGFDAAKIGPVMGAHERGERYKETDLPARPTIGPALEKNLPLLGRTWEGRIGP